MIDASARCPCGTGLTYDRCCRPLHDGTRAAVTAEALMRSRYTAYAAGDTGYVVRTWATTHRPAQVDNEGDIEWTGLVIRGTSGGAMFDDEGTVSFEAHYRRGGRDDVLAEVSRFARENGVWVYVDGVS